MADLVYSSISRSNVLKRAVWSVVYIVLFRATPRPLHRWRCFLLKLFGAKIQSNVRVYQSCKVWAPWNLVLDEGSCLGDYVDCYSVAPIHLRKGAVVSQYSYLCTASRDYSDASMPLMCSSIVIDEKAWVTADVFIGPGVTVGAGAVVTARSSVFDDIKPWTIASGNPAKEIKPRKLKDSIDSESGR